MTNQICFAARDNKRVPSVIPRFLFIAFLIFQSWTFANAQTADVVLYASETSVKAGNWVVETDATAAGGARIRYPDAGGPKLTTAFANPTHYFETTFTAEAGVAYRLWMRGKADANSTNNDSAFVQFSGSVTSTGTPVFRIGTTDATFFNLEECTGCGLSAWGWNDNLFGGLGPLIYFATSGTQTIRVQLREDGLAIDQIVLSPQTYLNTAPGAPKNDNTILPKPGGGPSITLVRQPYLQQVRGSTAIVVWATRESGSAEVRYWANNQTPQVVNATTRVFKQTSTGMAFDYYQHEAQLGNLLPATSYNYDIFVNGIDATPSVVDRFNSAIPKEPGSVSFVAFGDSGDGSAEQAQISNLIAKEPFDFALHAGDVAYEDGTYQQFHDFFFAPYSSWLRSRPVYPVIGNHDDRTSFALPYRELFVLPENGASATFPDHKERYYSFDYGPVHFVALDSELAFEDTARRQEQVNWLSADLAATTQPWRVVFFHRPPYSSGFHGSDVALQQAFGPIFEQRRVQLVINGHEHDYERIVPWRVTGPQAVTYIVTGGGGAELREVGQSPFTAVAKTINHYVRFNINGCELTIQAIDLNGATIDSYVLNRCEQANDAAPPTVSITQPAASATISGSTLVTGQASDDVRVEKVDLWVDGALKTIDTQAPYQFTWDTTTVPDGSHTIELRTYDIAGNRVSSGTRTVTVKNTSAANPDIVLYASETSVKAGNWVVEPDATAAGGARIRYPDAGGPKLTTAFANPTHYFETTFNAQAGVAYRLWMRGKADANSTNNDSAFVQFSGSVTSTGTPVFRIGTTDATFFNLEECTGCGLSAWGWNDNLFGGLGPLIYFATSGTQTIRVQLREDGLAIDQIVLSPQRYLNTAPGANKNDNTILLKSQ
ncbi:MAG TPA: Ig-like domain-containing protein [Pyrinomonadaceae bacterium]|nr:Ig-like domain-containing protein [Pyrinomonadaceae bacterium]